MKNKNNFKVGDNVIIDKEKIIKKYKQLPIWVSEKEFVIIAIKDHSDIEDQPIVELNKNLISESESDYKHFYKNQISTSFLKLNLKKNRCDKIKKLNKRLGQIERLKFERYIR